MNEWMYLALAVPWPWSEETISTLFYQNTNPRVQGPDLARFLSLLCATVLFHTDVGK
jgi:hypothetical protein